LGYREVSRLIDQIQQARETLEKSAGLTSIRIR
jgi:hypothetical protein